MKRKTKRRTWIAALAAALAAGVVAVAMSFGWGGSDGPPPDIVVVLVDTLRADHLGAYGHGRDTSPEIDALAERGLVFDRAFAHSGWTLPSAASLLTGLYPVEHGVVRDPVDRDAYGELKDDVPTLAGVLRKRGYRTGAFVNNVFLAPHFGLDQGFDRYDYRGSTNAEHRSAAATVEQALEWLDEAPADKPSFALVHFMEPHLDYDPPSSVQGTIAKDGGAVEPPVTAQKVAMMSQGNGGRPSPAQQDAISRIYDEEIRAVDAAVGRLASAVGERDRPSWLWLTADHGEELWDHGSFEHGHHLHGELVRVPLIAVGPDLEPARVDTPVQQIDLFRTLVSLGGGEPPEATHGTDVLTIADDPDAVAEDRPILHEDCLYGPWRAALTSGQWRVVVELPSRKASLWRLDEHGQGDRIVLDEAVEEKHLWGLLAKLFELRGSRELQRVSAGSESELGQRELEQLRSLGYVE